MSSEYLSSYIDNSGERAEDAVSVLLQKPTHDLAVENCFYYRQHGACTFLHTGNALKFFECMQRSAGCFIHMLKHEKEAEKRTSEAEAFFDAIAAGLLDAAKEIARYARTSCNFDYEYEDDFIYVHFLLSYFFRREELDEDALKAILDRYEEVLDGDLDARFDICQAFLDKDPAKFCDAFDQFLADREEKIAQKIASEAIGEEEWAWSRYLSVEALALLRLAAMLNFKTETNYRQVPEFLRSPAKANFNPDLWKSTMGVQYQEV